MSRWPIERRWQLLIRSGPNSDTTTGEVQSDSLSEITTGDLAGWPACCLLGAAGSGKTFELKRLAELEEDSGLEVRRLRLAEAASSPDGMAAALSKLASGATDRTAIYVDAVDEAMVPVVTTEQVLCQWISETIRDPRPRLRFTCRSAVWPGGVETAMGLAYGKESVTVASLRPLSDSDVLHVAASEDVDGQSFLVHVRRSGVITLAQQPLTLRMLVDLFKKVGGLPASRKALFSEAINLLSHERPERRKLRTVPDVAQTVIVEAAERLACFMVLSGSETVDLSDDPNTTGLRWRELSALPRQGRPLDDPLLRALGYSGLCEGDGPDRFRFIHRQVAEYLAGRRLARLLPHQSKRLLCSGLGWQAGVAGPLRETAAFAANESDELAQWVAETDPEVIGLSDIADDSLRRLATLGLLGRFRTRELTDSLLDRDAIRLEGLRYPGAEEDLRPVLKERGKECEDVLELAIELINMWQLDAMHPDLVDLFLDTTGPLKPRISAGYVLARSGSREQKRRLKPLVAGTPEDSNDELKGLALRCCWPEDLSTPELLASLKPWSKRSFHGSYSGFLIILDQAGFDAAGNRSAGLRWAGSVIESGPNPSTEDRIVRRIAHGAVGELDSPGVLDALVDLLLRAAEVHAESPLDAIRTAWLAGGADIEKPAPLASMTRERRLLLGRLIAMANDRDLNLVASSTPGLLDPKDFPWLLEKVSEFSTSPDATRRYLQLARILLFHNSQEAVECWLAHREHEPVKSQLNFPLSIPLDSEVARQARESFAWRARRPQVAPSGQIGPSREERILQALELSEAKTPRSFIALCGALTLTEDSSQDSFQRFLTRTPGWNIANSETRKRITIAARRILTSQTDAPETCRSIPLDLILTGYMEAAFLLVEEDRARLEEMPPEWWARWCWYFLRELHPHLSGEPVDVKLALFEMLHSRASESVRDVVIGLARDEDDNSRSLFIEILGLCDSVHDPDLNAGLNAIVLEGDAGPDREWHLARFLLRRDHGRAMESCRLRLVTSRLKPEPEAAVGVVKALLHDETSRAWELALGYLDDRPDLAREILAGYAHTEPDEHERSKNGHPGVTTEQVEHIIKVLLEQYPPEADKKHTGAYWVTAEDSAAQLRDRLLRWLGDQRTAEALEALRRLENRFGSKYPWLRRLRSAVERAYRQWTWTPIPPSTVASLLVDRSTTLIRNGQDAVAGILEAIRQFEWRLRHESPSSLEDFWNTPNGGRPSPKAEERVSDKLCEVIRLYFRNHTVTVDREVQVFRRNIPSTDGGTPGSEVDVLVRVPGPGTAWGVPITVPIEVKRSNNKEARTGLKEQLAERYMHQLGTDHGVFVVVWLDAPGVAKAHKPIWPNIEQARATLQQQADELARASGGIIHVSAIVVDASLV